MKSSYHKTLFIFRRDLRLEDNTALITALKSSEFVIPCFIFDPRQIGNQPYRSQAAIDFMVRSLMDLEGQLQTRGAKLYIFEGQAHEIVEKIIKSEKIDAVYVNGDYTPFSRKRDEDIMNACRNSSIVFHSFHDLMLNPPDTVKKNDGGIYSIFTPYFCNAATFDVANPVANPLRNYHNSSIKLEKREFFNSFLNKGKGNAVCPAGRQEALKVLKDLSKFNNYHEERNFPYLQATTKLSAHHKFGTCSIREVYHFIRQELGIDHTLIRELYWRDFFTQIGYHFPKVLGHAFHARYDDIKWENNTEFFQAWCEGKTGFPIVDSGMRELNATGFMHNRLRMITASFLVKDLLIDWRWGEKYFAQKLVDYDPLVNNGNWQWAASTGCDAQPYFRIFNPWLQQKKFDPQSLYIKAWIPEFKSSAYPKPIVDHKLQVSRVLAMYKRLL